jgi:hypothetical protein
MKQLLKYSLPVAAMLLCNCTGGEQESTTITDNPATITDISDVQPVLPQAGHVALVEGYCTPCHSLRYIEMQPRMSYTAWEHLVDKMITEYHAPIRDTVKRRQIIDYLHAIKGV